MRAPSPGEHGGDGALLASALGIAPDAVLDLSASLNPCAPDVNAIVGRHLDALRRYPDATDATCALAAALDVDPRRVVLTNGGSEAIALVAAEMPVGDVDDPDFSLYRRHLADVRAAAPRWRSNPHNPSGRLAPPGDLSSPNDVAVWDEAFYPLATGEWTSGAADDGAVVLGSLTKVFGCPGLRAGYVLAPDVAFADAVRARQPRWAVNGLAAAAIPELVESAELTPWRDAITALRTELVDALRAHGLLPAAADAPWVLVPDAADLRDRLAARAILVRDCASFGLRGTVRIAVPDAAGVARLTAALEADGD